jgi:DNA processing protein
MARPSLDLPEPPEPLHPPDPGWPAPVQDLADAPSRLWVAGRLPPWDRAVAIVGTRYADVEANDFARDLAGQLAAQGCPIISGGAYGIDAAAHEGALEAGGVTVAVLATGVARAYPPRHGPLFQRIVEAGGALVAEEEDCEAHRGRFLQRNRLVAALARAVVVVQAPQRSGALSTAAHARRLKRPVLAVPAAPWDPRGAGNLALLAQGGGICTRARDVLSLPAFGAGEGPNPPLPFPEAEKTPSMPDLPPDAAAVQRHLGSRPRHVDDLVRATGLPVAQVQGALLELQLQGLASDRGGSRFAAPPSRSGPVGH